ncbi:hypothetical protein HAX54_017250 [Datura stramonium]|uniref:Uncharacterized protein n=1 Tax=Datura stramonium TaxID=4076 RepID=A0ABS8UKK7_DATST|nr:hypothetical protein [Datura stramonium]
MILLEQAMLLDQMILLELLLLLLHLQESGGPGKPTSTFEAPVRGKGMPSKATSTFEEPTRARGRPGKDSSTSKEAEAPARGRECQQRSAKVTGDFDFKPRIGVRWKGKATITTGQLEEMRLTKRKKCILYSLGNHGSDDGNVGSFKKLVFLTNKLM